MSRSSRMESDTCRRGSYGKGICVLAKSSNWRSIGMPPTRRPRRRSSFRSIATLGQLTAAALLDALRSKGSGTECKVLAASRAAATELITQGHVYGWEKPAGEHTLCGRAS